MSADLILQPSETRITNLQFVKSAKFKPQSVILSQKWVNYSYDENGNQYIVKFENQKNVNSLMNLDKGKSGQYNGYMSPATRRNVRGMIENYLTAVQLSTSMSFPKSFPSTEVYPTFLTLTLPGTQIHCDNDVKEQFSRFMEYLIGSKENGNSGWNVKNYIWVAETQKNGNIHFHVILDRGIPKDRIRQEWNRIIERLGYVTRFRNRQEYIYQDGFYVRKDMLAAAIASKREYCRKTSQKFDLKETRKIEEKRQKEAYERGKNGNWNDPPTTKIHAIHSIKKLTAYVTKYMTKEPVIISANGESVKYERGRPMMETGERLIQENGKYFIEVETVNMVETSDGWNKENVSTERVAVVVQFENRVLRGRIWGASKALHVENLNPYTVALESFSCVTTTTVSYVPVRIKERAYTTDIFGEQVFSNWESVDNYVAKTDSVRDFDPKVTDHDAARWVQWLKEEHVPQSDIDNATAKAGEHFAHYGGEIIPLDHPHKDLLRAYSPLMYERYVKHYQGLFETLYPSIANAS